MQSLGQPNAPVKAKVVLIDGESMTVVWMNESASDDLPDHDHEASIGLPIEQAVPMTAALGVPEALHAVADTGIAQHLRANLVSTTRGSVTIAASLYRLPDGNLLLVMEHGWHVERDRVLGGHRSRGGRRAR